MRYPWTLRKAMVSMAIANARLIITLLVALTFLGQSLQLSAAWCMMPGPEPAAEAVESPSPCHGEADDSASADATTAASAPMDCCDTENCAMTGCMSPPPAFVALEHSFTRSFSHAYNASNPEARLSALPSSLFRPPNLR
jgi:hypothetical protein